MVEFVISAMRSKLRFLLLVAAAAIAGVFATNGWSWASGIVTFIALFIVLSAWALVSFWIWVFRNSGRETPR